MRSTIEPCRDRTTRDYPTDSVLETLQRIVDRSVLLDARGGSPKIFSSCSLDAEM